MALLVNTSFQKGVFANAGLSNSNFSSCILDENASYLSFQRSYEWPKGKRYTLLQLPLLQKFACFTSMALSRYLRDKRTIYLINVSQTDQTTKEK